MEIIDLETGEPIPQCFEKKMYDEDFKDDIIIAEIRPPILDNIFSGLEIDDWDPYSNLISSFWARDLNDCPTIIPIDQVLFEIGSEFAKRGLHIEKYLNP